MGNSEKSRTVLLLIGFAAGFTNGLFGAAGGIVIVMGLRAFFRDKMANGRSFYTTALAVMLPLSMLTAIQYAHAGYAPTLSPAAAALPAAAGGLLGAWILPYVKQALLHRIFAMLILISGIFMVV